MAIPPTSELEQFPADWMRSAPQASPSIRNAIGRVLETQDGPCLRMRTLSFGELRWEQTAAIRITRTALYCRVPNRTETRRGRQLVQLRW